MPFEQLYRFVAIVNHKLPRITHRLATEFQALDIGDNPVNLCETESIGIEFEEYLRMPICQSAVEIALPEVVVKDGIVACFAIMLTVELNALDTCGR